MKYEIETDFKIDYKNRTQNPKINIQIIWKSKCKTKEYLNRYLK